MKRMNTNNKIKFSSDHYGKWVALSSDKNTILDYSPSLSVLTKKLGTKKVVYMKPLDPSINYAF
jgi:hypothetical protein